MMPTGTAIELYRDWQFQLAKHGDTRHTRDLMLALDRVMARELVICPFDLWAHDAALEALHNLAFQEPRPPRLRIGEPADILE